MTKGTIRAWWAILEKHGITSPEALDKALSKRRRRIPPLTEEEAKLAAHFQDYWFLVLKRKLGEDVRINHAQLARVFRTRTLEGCTPEEFLERSKAWFESTDPFMVQNMNNVGLFDSKFHLLKHGPIHKDAPQGKGKIDWDRQKEWNS